MVIFTEKMKNYLVIAITIPLYLFFSLRGNTEILEFDLLKQKAIARNKNKIKQYLMELTILQIEEHEKYLRQKKYGPRSYSNELKKVEEALDIMINNCDYSIVNTLETLVAAQKICTKQTANYELLLKEVKAKITRKY